eukprot:2181728-Rhodomonas_salina.1
MALSLEFVMGAYMPLVDGVQDDGDDPIFQYIVVSLAIGHCALQSLPAPDNALIDVANSWKKNFTAIQKLIKPQTRLIGDWICEIEKTVQGLALAKVPGDAVNGAVCGNVIDCLGSFDDASDPTAARWLQRVDTMRTRNDARGYVWSELCDVIQSHLAANALKEEGTEAASAHTTPRKRKTVAPDGAAVFYTLAQVQAAYFMGQQQ